MLAAARGYRVGEIVVEHRKRQHGYSKYGVTRILKGFLDLLTVKFLTGFGQRPQHVLGTVGLMFFLLGGAGMLLLIAYRFLSWQLAFLSDIHLTETPWFYCAITSLLLGTQLMSIGFIAELITAYQARDMAPYSISARTGHRSMRRQHASSQANAEELAATKPEEPQESSVGEL